MRIRYLLNKLLFGIPQLEGYKYKRDLDLFILEGISSISATVLTGGAFLSGYALLLGASDYLAGIILTFPLLANLFQVFSAMLYERLESRKKTVMILLILYRAFACSVIFIPLVFPDHLQKYVLMIFVFISFLNLSVLAPALNNWLVSLIPYNVRGRYLSKRESLFQTASMIISLLMGRVLDVFGGGYSGFILVYAVVFLASLLNIWFLYKIYEPPVERKNLNPIKINELFAEPFKNKKYMSFVVFWMMWCFSAWMAHSYLNVYMIKYLKLSYTNITVLMTVQLITLVFFVRIWGVQGDKTCWEDCLKKACIVLACAFYLWVFTTRSTLFLLPIVHILAGVGWAGINLSSFNLVFRLSPEKGRTIFIGFNASASGIAGFLGPVIGGSIMEYFSNTSINLGFFQIDNMQILFLISAVCQSLVLLYGRNMKYGGEDCASL
ncbi:MAG: MFS transporter [Clostridia bacterium]|nr:MFS transporter [Clostridia bacterium]